MSNRIERIGKAIEREGDSCIVSEDKISLEYCLEKGIDFIVSYGYRHIINKDIVNYFEQRVINLHIGLLPWCRGAHPILWSVVEGRQIGVTIHYVDAGLDTGDIILQRKMTGFSEVETFETLHGKASGEIERLFEESWFKIRVGGTARRKQEGSGSIHRVSELEQWRHGMPRLWKTKVSDFERLASAKLQEYRKRNQLRASWK